MPIEAFTEQDLPQLPDLQPEEWNPLTPVFEFYLHSDFCFPVKYSERGVIAGVGVTIIHQHTAWLAHIIVHKEYRNKGIGSIITQALIHAAGKPGVQTILLLATALGEPVYQKHGFKKEGNYIFVKRDEEIILEDIPSVLLYQANFKNELLKFDYEISGEDRSKLIIPHLNETRIVVDQNTIQGYYIPTLQEGPIIARDETAAASLIQFKHASGITKAAFPEINIHATQLLTDLGFKEYMKSSRMYLGKPLTWQPAKIYSRIGGNLG